MSNLNINPLLSKTKFPGRVFQLPSKGFFYDSGVLADSVKDGEIQVRPMSALTELKIRSADLLISKKIIAEICMECIPEILKPEKMITIDVDALFLFLVISTNSNKKTISSIHDCEKAKVHTYEIDLDPITGNPRNGCLDHKDVLYSVDLPNKQRVKLKPVTFDQSVEMVLQRQNLNRKDINGEIVTQAELEKLVIDDLLSMIDFVEDEDSTGKIYKVNDKKQIEEWLRSLPRKYTEIISEAAANASEWGFDFKVELTCKDCKETYIHELDLNPVNFFSG